MYLIACLDSLLTVVLKFQLSQLLVCDWILETRTSLWEESAQNPVAPVSNQILSAFQKDLISLRKLAVHVPVSCGIFIELV